MQNYISVFATWEDKQIKLCEEYV